METSDVLKLAVKVITFVALAAILLFFVGRLDIENLFRKILLGWTR